MYTYILTLCTVPFPYSFLDCSIYTPNRGLGKTIISLSLICANPRPKHNQVLPREHIVSGKIDHPLYSPPPSVKGCTTSSAKNILLSNGTIVIVPMTLMSQWQSEVQRFAPWMSIITLHNDETSSVERTFVPLFPFDCIVIIVFLITFFFFFPFI